MGIGCEGFYFRFGCNVSNISFDSDVLLDYRCVDFFFCIIYCVVDIINIV